MTDYEAKFNDIAYKIIAVDQKELFNNFGLRVLQREVMLNLSKAQLPSFLCSKSFVEELQGYFTDAFSDLKLDGNPLDKGQRDALIGRFPKTMSLHFYKHYVNVTSILCKALGKTSFEDYQRILSVLIKNEMCLKDKAEGLASILKQFPVDHRETLLNALLRSDRTICDAFIKTVQDPKFVFPEAGALSVTIGGHRYTVDIKDPGPTAKIGVFCEDILKWGMRLFEPRDENSFLMRSEGEFYLDEQLKSGVYLYNPCEDNSFLNYRSGSFNHDGEIEKGEEECVRMPNGCRMLMERTSLSEDGSWKGKLTFSSSDNTRVLRIEEGIFLQNDDLSRGVRVFSEPFSEYKITKMEGRFDEDGDLISGTWTYHPCEDNKYIVYRKRTPIVDHWGSEQGYDGENRFEPRHSNQFIVSQEGEFKLNDVFLNGKVVYEPIEDNKFLESLSGSFITRTLCTGATRDLGFGKKTYQPHKKNRFLVSEQGEFYGFFGGFTLGVRTYQKRTWSNLGVKRWTTFGLFKIPGKWLSFSEDRPVTVVNPGAIVIHDGPDGLEI